jgi:3-(3-hydroxy-phenyl)propionate hydroxylase
VSNDFSVLSFCERARDCAPLSLSSSGESVIGLLVAGDDVDASPGWTMLRDREGVLRQRYDARSGTTYLIRPDLYEAGRWRRFDATAVLEALKRAGGRA